MSLAATIKAMAAAGCTMDQVIAVVEAHEANGASDIERRRANDRDRKQRSRHVTSREVTGSHVTERTGPSPKEKSPTPPKEITPTHSSLRSDDSSRDPKSILAEVLPDQTAVELIAHRKAKRSPITAGAARGLVRAFIAYGNPVAAAEAMMTHGWNGFKPEWMTDARGARAGPAPRGRTVADLAAMNLHDEPDIFDDPRSDPRHSPPESPDRSDETRGGFVGRLSEPAARSARRGALIDH